MNARVKILALLVTIIIVCLWLIIVWVGTTTEPLVTYPFPNKHIMLAAMCLVALLVTIGVLWLFSQVFKRR